MAQQTPVTPRSGGLVHATSLTDAHRTACGRICAGWRVALKSLSCQRCKEVIFFPVAAGAKARR